MKLEGFIKILGIALGIALVLTLLYFIAVPSGRATWNNYQHSLQQADDKTLYSTKQQVENTCRSMIAFYNADKLTYEQYKDSVESEKQSWAEQAKIRANRTAASYNEYILKNAYVWQDNIPKDIAMELRYLD